VTVAGDRSRRDDVAWGVFIGLWLFTLSVIVLGVGIAAIVTAYLRGG
jgi:hypothetical protein